MKRMEQAILFVIESGWRVKEENSWCELREWFYPVMVNCRSTILNLSVCCGEMRVILGPLREEFLGQKFWELVDERTANVLALTIE